MERKENTAIEQLTKEFLVVKTKEGLKQSTLSRYTFIAERHIIPYFKGVNIAELTNSTINNFVQYKLTNGSLC